MVVLTVHHFWEKQLSALGCSESSPELWERGYKYNPALLFFPCFFLVIYSCTSFVLTERTVPKRILLENDIQQAQWIYSLIHKKNLAFTWFWEAYRDEREHLILFTGSPWGCKKGEKNKEMCLSFKGKIKAIKENGGTTKKADACLACSYI